MLYSPYFIKLEGWVKKRIYLILLGGMFLLCMSFRVNAQTEITTLELTVRQVVVEDGVASITGPAAGSKVELYDNLGEELIASGTTDASGVATFQLTEKYPLSVEGLFYTTVKLDGFDNGVFTCQQGQTCQETVFTVDGMSPDLEDGILIVKVVRSTDLTEPVDGINLNVFPASEDGVQMDMSQEDKNYDGIKCSSNSEGFCAAYLDKTFRWADEDGVTLTYTMIKYRSAVTFDGSGVYVPEGQLRIVHLAVDAKEKMDDCTFKTALPGRDLKFLLPGEGSPNCHCPGTNHY